MLNKPPGLATQGGTKTTQHLDRLLDGLADGAARPKLVHRLDKDTSGALLVARTARAAGHFAKAFSGRTARKVYWALVVGVPVADEGMIDAPLAKQPGTGGEKMHISEEHGLPAKTRWRLIDHAGNRAAWVELQPLTGRTHQLRAHMAAIGHPIVGDAKYGGPEAFLTGGISRKLHLHARRLRIDAPEGGKIDVTAELPAHFAETWRTRFRSRCRRHAAAERPPRTGTKQRKRGRGQARRRERRGERRSRGSQPRRSGGDPGRDLRLRRHARRQRRHHLMRPLAKTLAGTAWSYPPPKVCPQVIGLSLIEAMAAPKPDAAPKPHLASSAETTRAPSSHLRAAGQVEEPLFDGILSCSTRWKRTAGCSRSRPANRPRPTHCLEHHGIHARFVSLQTADRHPSKPHPSMVEQAIADAGAAAETTSWSATPASTWHGGRGRRAPHRRRLGLSRCHERPRPARLLWPNEPPTCSVMRERVHG